MAMDAASIRFAAASALLRLARAHDSLLTPAAYQTLALVMQARMLLWCVVLQRVHSCQDLMRVGALRRILWWKCVVSLLGRWHGS